MKEGFKAHKMYRVMLAQCMGQRNVSEWVDILKSGTTGLKLEQASFNHIY